MEIKDLNKPQLVLLTLLISFVVSIATGITAVSLLQKVPTTVSQTINKVIHETISKDAKEDVSKDTKTLGSNSGLSVSIYTSNQEKKLLGEGVVVSDAGVVMVESSLLLSEGPYIVTLNSNDFTANVIKKFSNGITLLQIVEKGTTVPKTEVKDTDTKPATTTPESPATDTKATN